MVALGLSSIDRTNTLVGLCIGFLSLVLRLVDSLNWLVAFEVSCMYVFSLL